MDERFTTIFDAGRRIALTADEKAAGREMLRSYMALTPVRQDADVRARSGLRKLGLARFNLVGKAAGVFALTLSMLLSVAGVSYAAEGSLPGDALYPVKVGVNEELQAALAPSPEAKAAWEAERAERRLSEAEALAKKGQLKTETRVALETEFKRHADNAKAHIAEFRASSNADAATDVESHLEGSLRAHTRILAALALEDGGQDTKGDDGRKEIAGLAASVDAETVAAVEERDKTEANAPEDDAAKADARAAARRAAAETAIADVRTYLSGERETLGAEAVTEAEARLLAAEAVVSGGDADRDAGDQRAALAAYAKAQRSAREARLLIRAGRDLQVKFRPDDGNGTDPKAAGPDTQAPGAGASTPPQEADRKTRDRHRSSDRGTRGDKAWGPKARPDAGGPAVDASTSAPVEITQPQPKGQEPSDRHRGSDPATDDRTDNGAPRADHQGTRRDRNGDAASAAHSAGVDGAASGGFFGERGRFEIGTAQ